MGNEALSLPELDIHGAIVEKVYEGSVDGSAATSGNTHNDPIDVSRFKEANFFLNVTAIAGTTKELDVKMVTKNPGADKWGDVVTFTQAAAVTHEMKEKSGNLGIKNAMEWTCHADTTATFTVYAVYKVNR